MIKCEGLLGKLESRYHGRFFIKHQTEDGNYKLLNSLGNEIEKSYPIKKLKPILEDEEISNKESVEIEKILNKRKNDENDKIEYLVKWKYLDESENEWVPEDHFDEFKLINEYNAKIHRDENVEHNSPIEQPIKRGRGRPRRVMPLLSIIISLLLITTSFCNESEPKGKTFKFKDNNMYRCDIAVDRIAYLQDNCKLNYANSARKSFSSLDTYISKEEYAIKNLTLKSRLNEDDDPRLKTLIYTDKVEDNRFVNKTEYLIHTRMFILAKQHDEVSADAYECSLVKYKKILTSTFYNSKLPPVVTSEKIKLAKEHCNMMIQFKMCANKPLICIGDTCKTQFTPDSELDKFYGWWKTNVLIEDICTIKKI